MFKSHMNAVMSGSQSRVTKSFVEATGLSRIRTGTTLLEGSGSSVSRDPDPATIYGPPTPTSPSQSTKPLIVQLPSSFMPSSVIHHFGSSSSTGFPSNSSDPSPTNPATPSFPPQGPAVPNSKKQKLLRRCHRHLKRLLRSSGVVHSSTSGSTTDTCEKCPNCLMNNNILLDLQTKYSDLVQEVASLQRQLTAVQHAFTSLRTMLLASFISSPSNQATSSDLNTLSTCTPLVAVPTSYNPAVTFSMAPFGNSQQISGAGSLPTALSTVVTESIAYEPASTITPSNCMQELPSSNPGIAAPILSSALELTTSSSNFAHLPTDPPHIKSDPSDTLHAGLSTSSDKDSSSSVVMDSAVSRLDPFTFIQSIRDRMRRLNISQRTLGREFLGVNERALGEIMRKPRPWNQLTPHARSVYERLYDWLNKESQSDFIKESLSSPSSASTCPAHGGQQSSIYDEASPSIPCNTDGTSSNEQALEELCSRTEPVAASPPEVYASPNSFTSAPPFGSDLASEPDLLNRQTQEAWRTCSLANGQVATRDSNAHNESSSRRLPSRLDQETQRRIRDILCQARLAMAMEKSDDRSETGTRRRKRAASTESENCPKRFSVMNCDAHPTTSQAPNLDAESDKNCLKDFGPPVSEEPLSIQPSEFHPPPTLSPALSAPIMLPDCSGAISSSAPCIFTPGAQGNCTTMNIIASQNEPVSFPLTALQLNRASNVPFNSTVAQIPGTVQIPHITTPFAAFSLNGTPAGSQASFPLGSPALQSLSSISSSSQMTLTVPQSLLPGLVQVPTPSVRVTNHPVHSVIPPLQQTLLLLAAASAARGHSQAAVTNATSFPSSLLSYNLTDSVANAILSSAAASANCTTGVRYNSAADTCCNADTVREEGHGSDNLTNYIAPVASTGSAELASLLSARITRSSSSQPPSTETLTLPDSATLEVFSKLNLHQLTSCQLKQLSDRVPPLNTFDLANQIRNHLRDLNVSQRLFGDFVLGLSQASVSELLNKPRPWDQLSPRAKLAYLQLYAWLQQPDRIESLKQTQLTHRQRYLYSIPELSALDTDGATFLESSTDLNYAGVSQMGTQDDALQHPFSSILANPPHQEPPFPTDCPNGSSDQLCERDRQSLFDIARAAAAAMQRANSTGSTGKLARTKAQVDSPMKNATPSRLSTPLKSDSSGRSASVSAETGNLTCTTISPSKLSPARNRVVFTETQKEALVSTFNRQPYPHSDRLRELAKELDLSYKTILNWFHNRRMRSRQPLIPTERDGPENHLAITKPEPVQRVFSDPHRFNGDGPICNISASSHTDTASVECDRPSVHFVCPNSQPGHPNRRKRPDPARLITPCL
ncbi:unnamed protein product [Dicrocoelium dendriticum]|nr:unnamed protein product [Dicrocoelium dendriticum]